MKKCDLAGIFFRSLSIQSSWSFRGMQNVGFAYSLIPLVRSGGNKKWISEILTRHLLPFSSHPYLTGAIIASVARLEEESGERSDRPEAPRRKEALMAPYAAVGDPFFWGGLRPFSSVAAVILALEGVLFAPLLFLIAYNSIHIWIRLKGFMEGYQDGKGGIGFLGRIALPYKTRRLKWSATFFLALLGAVFVDSSFPLANLAWVLALGGTLVLVLLCSWLVGRGISSLAMLYGATLFFVVIV
ncbi:MAG: PTS system mannose/fructose/sorbose family transporter subunit IID [Deltaproteobacteria bacterium]|nr:PTS system mannose/fructose/sorbose family transporter subunit IID [Deltaproteobacteria bacterium]